MSSPRSGYVRRVNTAFWRDDRYLSLSSPAPDPRYLYWFLRLGPFNSAIPGVFEARAPGLADCLGWTLDDFFDMFRECWEAGLVDADWSAGLVYVVDAAVDEPKHANLRKGWEKAWSLLPDCELKRIAYRAIMKVDDGGSQQDGSQTELKRIPKRSETELKRIPKRSENLPSAAVDNPSSGNAKKKPSRARTRAGLGKGSAIRDLGKKVNNRVHVSKSNDLETARRPVRSGERKADKSLRRARAIGTLVDTKVDDRPSSADLFSLPLDKRRELVALLLSTPKTKPEMAARRKLVSRIEDDVLRVYLFKRGAATDSDCFLPDKKKSVEYARKIGFACIGYGMTPETLFDFWMENNYTEAPFPPLSFLSGSSNLEKAWGATMTGKRPARKKGMREVKSGTAWKGFDDDLAALEEKSRDERDRKTQGDANG